MTLGHIKIFIILMLSVLVTSCASSPPPPKSISTIMFQPVPSIDPIFPQMSYNSPQEYIDGALVLFNQGKYRETLGFLELTILRDSEDFRAYALRGVTWSMLGDGSKARQDFLKTIEINGKSKEADTSRLWLEKLNNPLSVAVTPLNLNTNANLINNGKRTHQSGGKNERRTRGELIQKQFADFSHRNYDPTFKSILGRSGFFQPNSLDRQTNVLNFSKVCPLLTFKGAKIVVFSKRADLNLIEKTYPATFMYGTPAGVLPIATNPLPYFGTDKSYDIELIFDIDVYETKQCSKVTTFNKSMTARTVSGKQVGSVVSHMLDVLFHQINLEIHDALL